MEQQNLLEKCYENFEKFKEDIKNLFDNILKIRKDFMEENNNCINDKLFDIMKSKFKDYSESISSLQSSIDGIKIKKEQINYLFTQYENFKDLDNYIEINNQINQERIIFEGYPEFCEEKIKSYDLNGKSKSEKEIKSLKVKIINLDYYYYSISFCSKSPINIDADFNSIIKELEYSNSTNKMCLSKIHKNVYINDIIKSNKLKDNNIIPRYISECPIFNEIKLLVDFLINQCKIKKEDLDYKGNAIYYNLSQNNKRGQEKYDPPHGCISIGLRCIGKYKNDDWLNNNSESSTWTIAYYGIGNLSKHKDIKTMIYNINKYGLKPGNSQDKMGQKDKRHPQKTIGKGVYLYPKYKNAEENSGIIYINQYQYKIILMARVRIEKISEPEDAEQWILQNDDIRIYRLLFQRIN